MNAPPAVCGLVGKTGFPAPELWWCEAVLSLYVVRSERLVVSGFMSGVHSPVVRQLDSWSRMGPALSMSSGFAIGKLV